MGCLYPDRAHDSGSNCILCPPLIALEEHRYDRSSLVLNGFVKYIIAKLLRMFQAAQLNLAIAHTYCKCGLGIDSRSIHDAAVFHAEA
jgi:hypothetical protein